LNRSQGNRLPRRDSHFFQLASALLSVIRASSAAVVGITPSCRSVTINRVVVLQRMLQDVNHAATDLGLRAMSLCD
jgi:hypothetical protein